MSIAKKFAELALARFKKPEPETPEYEVACERIVTLFTEFVDNREEAKERLDSLKMQEEFVNSLCDEDYRRSLKDD